MSTMAGVVFVVENSSTGEDCQNRAEWEAINRIARSAVYMPTVAEHAQNGIIWDINKVVDVVDERARIDADMLINAVVFNQNLTAGSTTKLTCLPVNAYSFPAQSTRGRIGAIEGFELWPIGPY